MSIKRSPRRSTYTTLDNVIFESALSFRAIGLLAYLLSKPDHWTVSVAQLVNYSAASVRPDGRDSLYAILNELIDKGYITRARVQQGGKMGGYEYEVFETPQPCPALPYTEAPCPAAPYTAEPTLVNTESKQILNEVNTEEELLSAAAKKPYDGHLINTLGRYWGHQQILHPKTIPMVRQWEQQGVTEVMVIDAVAIARVQQGGKLPNHPTYLAKVIEAMRTTGRAVHEASQRLSTSKGHSEGDAIGEEWLRQQADDTASRH